jgi:hypothetical protein
MEAEIAAHPEDLVDADIFFEACALGYRSRIHKVIILRSAKIIKSSEPGYDRLKLEEPTSFSVRASRIVSRRV